MIEPGSIAGQDIPSALVVGLAREKEKGQRGSLEIECEVKRNTGRLQRTGAAKGQLTAFGRVPSRRVARLSTN